MHIAIRLVLSVMFSAIGVIGLILPILPGWIFFAFVAMILFPNARLTRTAVARIEERFPSMRRLLRFMHADAR